MTTVDIQRLRRTVPFPINLSTLPGNAVVPGLGPGSLLNRLALADDTDGLPRWWSPERDRKLSTFWQQDDHISGAISNFVSKMTGIDFSIVPKDTTVPQLVERAKRTEEALMMNSGFGLGFKQELSKWLIDYTTQDNGAFFLILGDGPVTGPIIGPPLGVLHLDAQRCTRTGQFEFPIIYTDATGRPHKIHDARVMYSSSMPSPRADMFNVGTCALSRMAKQAKHFMNIVQYENERIGTEPPNQLLVGGGIRTEDIIKAMIMSEKLAKEEGLQKFRRTIAIGSLENLRLEKININDVPSGWDKLDENAIGMAIVAMALMWDVREIFPVSAGGGATRASALIEHIKGRLRGPGQIQTDLGDMFDSKYCPSGVRAQPDLIDEQQEDVVTTIWNRNSERRTRDLTSGVTSVRTQRVLMLRRGEIERSEFIEDELEDGRLEDGSDVLVLIDNPDIDPLLNFGRENVVYPEMHEAEVDTIVDEIRVKITDANKMVYNASGIKDKLRAKEILAALKKLLEEYESFQHQQEMLLQQEMEMEAETEDEGPQKPPNDVQRDRDERRTNTGLQPNQDNGVGMDRQALNEKILVSKQGGDYKKKVTDIINKAFAGSINGLVFTIDMQEAIDKHLKDAFVEGIQETGASAELSAFASQRLENELFNQKNRLNSLLNAINDAQSEGNLRKLDSRISLWSEQYDHFKSIGMLYGPDEVRLKWVIDPAKDHCFDCVKFNGEVATTRAWREADIEPKSQRLECKGFYCGCTFIVTEDDITLEEVVL